MRIRISGGLYAAILMSLGMVLPVMVLPGPLIKRAGQEAWLAVLLGGLYGLVAALFVVWIACRFPDRDPLTAIDRTLGRWAAVPIRGLYGAWNLFVYVLALHEAQDFVVSLLLPQTPGAVMGVLIGWVALYAVWAGIEPIARIAFGSILPVALVVLLLPAAVYRDFSLLHIDPFLWKGFGGLLQATVVTGLWAGQSLVALSLLRHLTPKANPYRWTLVGVGGGSLLVALTVALVSLAFGSVLPGRLLYPVYELLAVIAFTEAIERIQAAILVLWLGASLVKVTVNLYAAVEEWSDVLGQRHRRIIAAVLATAGVAAAQIIEGPLQMAGLAERPGWSLLHWGTQGVILLMLAGAAFMAGRRQGGSLHG